MRGPDLARGTGLGWGDQDWMGDWAQLEGPGSYRGDWAWMEGWGLDKGTWLSPGDQARMGGPDCRGTTRQKAAMPQAHLR